MYRKSIVSIRSVPSMFSGIYWESWTISPRDQRPLLYMHGQFQDTILRKIRDSSEGNTGFTLCPFILFDYLQCAHLPFSIKNIYSIYCCHLFTRRLLKDQTLSFVT
jgi:hypothetical protein